MLVCCVWPGDVEGEDGHVEGAADGGAGGGLPRQVPAAESGERGGAQSVQPAQVRVHLPQVRV